MDHPDIYEMDRRLLSMRPPTGSSTATISVPQTEKVYIQVKGLENEETLKRGLGARQVSTTTYASSFYVKQTDHL